MKETDRSEMTRDWRTKDVIINELDETHKSEQFFMRECQRLHHQIDVVRESANENLMAYFFARDTCIRLAQKFRKEKPKRQRRGRRQPPKRLKVSDQSADKE
jgi:hypothetical protein